MLEAEQEYKASEGSKKMTAQQEFDMTCGSKSSIPEQTVSDSFSLMLSFGPLHADRRSTTYSFREMNFWKKK